jgi:hypothetical protein
MRDFTKLPTSVGSIARLVPANKKMLKEIPIMLRVKFIVMNSSQNVVKRYG